MRRIFIESRSSGFTFTELLAVVTILGVLAYMIVPRLFVNTATTNENACDVNQGHIEVQVQRWKRQHGTWPNDDLSDMLPTSSPAQYEYFPGGVPTCPVDGSPYVLDSVTHEVSGHNH
jgi:prepilin-type N-terminal cleavage/methylation domain-containing protein